jgi:hypothetical protein
MNCCDSGECLPASGNSGLQEAGSISTFRTIDLAVMQGDVSAEGARGPHRHALLAPFRLIATDRKGAKVADLDPNTPMFKMNRE